MFLDHGTEPARGMRKQNHTKPFPAKGWGLPCGFFPFPVTPSSLVGTTLSGSNSKRGLLSPLSNQETEKTNRTASPDQLARAVGLRSYDLLVFFAGRPRSTLCFVFISFVRVLSLPGVGRPRRSVPGALAIVGPHLYWAKTD